MIKRQNFVDKHCIISVLILSRRNARKFSGFPKLFLSDFPRFSRVSLADAISMFEVMTIAARDAPRKRNFRHCVIIHSFWIRARSHVRRHAYGRYEEKRFRLGYRCQTSRAACTLRTCVGAFWRQ